MSSDYDQLVINRVNNGDVIEESCEWELSFNEEKEAREMCRLVDEDMCVVEEGIGFKQNDTEDSNKTEIMR